MRILVVEDDQRLNQALKMSLMDEGYAVDVTFDGEDGEAFAESTAYDAIILDIMLPRKDGIAVCHSLRRHEINTPILMLTARDAIEDRVRGLDSGADDYLVKPFALHELLARLRALMRRTTPQKSGLLCHGDLIVNPATHTVEREGLPIKLNAKEFALLEYFIRHPHQVLTRESIENHIWSYDFISASNVVDVYVRRLRRKLDDPFPVKLLETIYGAGYRLRLPLQMMEAKK
ncbi:response regulator transcription factor [Tengunoibacter tsumagoiensis]|uniref:DNA-binding response regulator n=1 Tax=Tengunoibacter tsumagoiensis TaxID=2014871 RepID=A0A402A171_9CHLR|nr:response regulator transcription factor [Tengunoibacter tsumagoiensis]GCE12910.1 DNA-binding response regulator [Tengunoibacter tsumagoiensis]